MLFHPWWPVLLLLRWSVAVVAGVVLSVVFQLAHCVEEAEFPCLDEDTGRMENAWAVHQVRDDGGLRPRTAACCPGASAG